MKYSNGRVNDTAQIILLDLILHLTYFMHRALLDGTGWPVAERQGLAMVWIDHNVWKR